MTYDENDLVTLAKTLYGEARGEPTVGQIAVAWVIRNRASRPAFVGMALAGKIGSIFQACTAPWQFSCWNVGDPNREKLLVLGKLDYASQYKIALDIMVGIESDPTNGADHYHTIARPPGVDIWPPTWAPHMVKTATIGHHVFYNSQVQKKPVLYRGSVGPYVTAVQAALGITMDGDFGPQTYGAVRNYQETHNLTVDGMVGDQTYGALGIV